jgi:hypothetical protein
MDDECEGIWKGRRGKPSVRVAIVPAEIRIQRLWNTSLEKYRCATPRCASVVIKAWILNSSTPGGGVMDVCRILSTQISILEVD